MAAALPVPLISWIKTAAPHIRMDTRHMGSLPSSAAFPVARMAGVGAVVFLANAALLVLQLVASRLLAPFIGSDLYTWTAIIGVFLTGIALGNAYGGKLADRYPSPRTLAAVLLLGAATAVWMAVAPLLFHGFYRSIPLGPRIPLLSALLCLPAGFVLSLLTPLSIKLGLPDVSKTGRVAGMIFALSTLGCLLGNYVTGFYLVPVFTINMLVYVSAGSLLVLAIGVFVVLQFNPPAPISEEPSPDVDTTRSLNPYAFANIQQAFAVVFLASFCGMTLELTASRIIAEKLGVSLYTWTGIIGVMLAGTALGNLTGGILADRANRPGSTINPRTCLAAWCIIAGAGCVVILLGLSLLTNLELFESFSLVGQVLGWTFILFFLPMFALGTISPQVIRLAVPDVEHAGRVAGRVYAWSTVGAIVGTFAAGYVLISLLTVNGTVIAIVFLLAGLSLRIAKVWKNNLLLYLLAIVLGGSTGGILLIVTSTQDDDIVVVRETNYYKIKVSREYPLVEGERVNTLKLTLDHLVHSSVNPDDPTFIYYEHEHMQMELLRAARAATPNPRLLVIGGGGYTFPRYAKALLPETELDVVEIDPGVTRVAYEFLGLKKELGIRDYNMDGRQFVAEKAAPHSYDLIVQDAVNDLSVPWHLLTREYNDAVKAALKPDGVYLLTIIDEIEHGKLWRASMATLRETFPHVMLLSSAEVPVLSPNQTEEENEQAEIDMKRMAEFRQVYVIYASARPLDVKDLHEKNVRVANAKKILSFHTHLVQDRLLDPFLQREPGVILTDQYAPVDNLMAEVFRRRNK
jgi:spermidine synthase/MFS family permease